MRPRICLTLLSLLVGVSVEAKPYKNYSPAWSPDGQELAFYSDRDGNWEIYLVAADGSNLRRLTFDPSDDTQPSYSPDGSSILFSSDREGDFDVYLMPRAGGPARNLTQAPSAESAPTFSPDGHSIAFMSDRGGSEQIYLMAADGSGVERLTKVVEEIGRPGRMRHPAGPTVSLASTLIRKYGVAPRTSRRPDGKEPKRENTGSI